MEDTKLDIAEEFSEYTSMSDNFENADLCETNSDTKLFHILTSDPGFEDSAWEIKNPESSEDAEVEQKDPQKKHTTKNKKQTSDKFKCPHCTKTFPTQEKFNQHSRQPHPGINAFTCTLCDYSTVKKTLYQEHNNIHLGIKPFKCKFCDHTSACKRNINKHEKLHIDGRLLQCNKCEVFGGPLKIKKHETKCNGTAKVILKKNQDLTGIFLFNCMNCKWRSQNKIKVLLHLIHHPNQDPPDNLDVSVLRKYEIIK